MSTILQTKNSKLLENPGEIILGLMLGQDQLQKNLGGYLVRSDEILSPRQTSIDKNQRLRHEL